MQKSTFKEATINSKNNKKQNNESHNNLVILYPL
jgi:hypothetical protein